MKTADLFQKSAENVPADIAKRVDLSFEIADKIECLLQERGMTQREFARKIGKRESEVSKWLCGTHNFTLSTLSSISCALGTDIIKVN